MEDSSERELVLHGTRPQKVLFLSKRKKKIRCSEILNRIPGQIILRRRHEKKAYDNFLRRQWTCLPGRGKIKSPRNMQKEGNSYSESPNEKGRECTYKLLHSRDLKFLAVAVSRYLCKTIRSLKIA